MRSKKHQQTGSKAYRTTCKPGVSPVGQIDLSKRQHVFLKQKALEQGKTYEELLDDMFEETFGERPQKGFKEELEDALFGDGNKKRKDDDRRFMQI